MEVDGGVLVNNARAVKERLDGSAMLCAMVKANAYGHGLTLVAKLLQDEAQCFGVATVKEGVLLRESGVDKPILLTAYGCADGDLALQNDITVTVETAEQLYALQSAAERQKKRCAVHIKADTGMNRLGVKTERELNALLAVCAGCKRIDVTGCYTHFYSSDRELCNGQFARFTELSANLREQEGVLLHASASTGVLLDPLYRLDMVRIGILLYGYYPYPAERYPIRVSPCATLSGDIISVKQVSRGECVSYNGTHVFQADTRIAAVRLGYGDGVFRSLGNRGGVIIGGKKCAVVGNVCMDLLMADVGNTPVKPGDRAYLLCREQSADEVAEKAGTISYEVLASLTDRIERKLK